MYWNLLRGRRETFLFLSCLTLLAILLWQTGFLSKVFLDRKAATQEIRNSQNGQPVKLDPEAAIQFMDQTDKNLLLYVRTNHIFPPSVLEYNVPKDHKFSLPGYIFHKSFGKTGLFKNKTNGFFIEAGANDGVFFESTLMLERDYGWSGLLIECHPDLVPKLKAANRKAYISDVCLSSTTHPFKTKMRSSEKVVGLDLRGWNTLGSGHLFPKGANYNFTTYIVQTVPLYTIIASIDVKEVDLIVLDVHSFELDVLHNFPYDLILVKVWWVEVYFYSNEQRKDLVKFMDEKGYPQEHSVNTGHDILFVHKSHMKLFE